MKKHTGESPEKIIDQSFADIAMAPLSQIGASVVSRSGPNTRRISKISASQPANGTISKISSKRTRGMYTSPEYNKASKKPAINKLKS